MGDCLAVAPYSLSVSSWSPWSPRRADDDASGRAYVALSQRANISRCTAFPPVSTWILITEISQGSVSLSQTALDAVSSISVGCRVLLAVMIEEEETENSSQRTGRAEKALIDRSRRRRRGRQAFRSRPSVAQGSSVSPRPFLLCPSASPRAPSLSSLLTLLPSHPYSIVPPLARYFHAPEPAPYYVHDQASISVCL